jgi:mannose-6-phosphate isomerase-like protein (cupin superfamily)
MDTTVTKVDSHHSPRGEQGELHLASGKTVAMRMWREGPGDKEGTAESSRAYETVGFVIRGRAELLIEGQVVTLAAGDSWVVPRGSRHRYRILEPFEAVEATAPPYHVGNRSSPP